MPPVWHGDQGPVKSGVNASETRASRNHDKAALAVCDDVIVCQAIFLQETLYGSYTYLT